MNTISLWQPWASGIELGVKTIETRGWCAPDVLIGEPIAIHAAKRDTRETREAWMRLVKRVPAVAAIFAAAGYNDWEDLPFGAVVATTRLIACVETTMGICPGMWRTLYDQDWGNFEAARFAWYLGDVKRVHPAVPEVGRQGIWQWRP